MAFSMFYRNPACRTMFSQQLMKLSQASLPQRVATQPLALTQFVMKDSTSTPISNAVRSIHTSAVRFAEEKGHDHAKLWVVEKATSALLVPLLPLGLLMPNKIIDSLLAILITAHSFWGLEAIAVDYVRAAIFGPVIPKIAIALVYIISIATLGGLFYIISHDVGISNAIRQFWSIRSEQKA